MFVFLFILYVIIGAVIGSVYYYLQLRRDKYNNSMEAPIWIGAAWPIVAPFAFGFYYAKELSRKDDKR